MKRTREETNPPGTPSPARAGLLEVEKFFMKESRVHTTLERLARRLDEHGIPYAIIGGMALSLHGYTRVTQNVDVLMTTAGLEAFERHCLGRGYVRGSPERRDRSTKANRKSRSR